MKKLSNAWVNPLGNLIRFYSWEDCSIGEIVVFERHTYVVVELKAEFNKNCKYYEAILA